MQHEQVKRETGLLLLTESGWAKIHEQIKNQSGRQIANNKRGLNNEKISEGTAERLIKEGVKFRTREAYLNNIFATLRLGIPTEGETRDYIKEEGTLPIAVENPLSSKEPQFPKPRAKRASVRTKLRDQATAGAESIVEHHDVQQDGQKHQQSKSQSSGNLPIPFTCLVGREKDITEVREFLAKPERRLVTLVGPGGVGKTRLAIEVGFQVALDYSDGVWFVNLAALSESDAGSIAAEVATVLKVREDVGQPLTETKPLLETLKTTLANRSVLLILDNCEHLQKPCAEFVRQLISAVPNLKALATSQKPLGLYGEQQYPVMPLRLPPQEYLVTKTEALMEYAAVKLFVERAQQVKPAFHLNHSNAEAVLNICRRLDGVPLAIELAAARSQSLTPKTIERELNQRLDWIGTDPTVLPKHRTLRALCNWAYDLLRPQERMLLGRLSVFTGGWTLEAAQQICQGKHLTAAEVPDLLLSLAGQSLVVVEDQEGTERYRLLETLREYAAEKLLQDGGTKRMKNRHRAWCLALARRDRLQSTQSEQTPWRLLETEYENVRAALNWSMEKTTTSGPGLLLVDRLKVFWNARGLYSDGLDWCGKILQKTGGENHKLERTNVLKAATGFAYLRADYDAAQHYHEQVLLMQQEFEDPSGMADSHSNLGLVYLQQGRLAEARFAFEASLHIRQAVNYEEGVADALYHIGLVEYAEGNYNTAQGYFTRSLQAYENIRDQEGVAYQEGKANAHYGLGLVFLSLNEVDEAARCLNSCLSLFNAIRHQGGIAEASFNLGLLALVQGNYAAARAYFESSWPIRKASGDWVGIADLLEAFAGLKAVQGKPQRAAHLWGTAEALRLKINAPILPYKQKGYSQDIEVARVALDAAEFNAAWTKGQALTLEQAYQIAINDDNA